MQTWLNIDEFAKLSGKNKKDIFKLCKEKKLKCKKNKDGIFIEVESVAKSLVPLQELQIIEKEHSIVDRTVGMFLALHEKVLISKDETIEALKDENQLLKETIYSMQEVYDESKKTIERLQKQLEIAQEELEFCRRKYKLMWGRVLKKENGEE